MTIAGVGAIVASALVAAVGQAEGFAARARSRRVARRWFPVSSRPAASRSCSVSASAATNTCADS